MRLRGATSFPGSELAVGVLVGGPGVRDTRARVLALWSPGTRVHVIGERYLVLFATARRVRAEAAPGAIVCARHDVLTTVPLDTDTVRTLDPAPGTLVIADAGALVSVALPAASRPADWIDVSGIATATTTALGPEPAPPVVPAAASRDVRAAIGDRIPERAPGAQTMRELTEGAGASTLPPAGDSVLGALRRWLRGLFARRPALPSGTGTGTGTDVLAPATPRTGWLDRLRGWLAERVMRSSLSRLLARRQAEYVARMLELFERGDISEALKWAIPLGGNESSGPATLALPTPRTSLAIGTRTAPARSMMGLPGLYELLRRRYQAVFERLQVEGRIDEAAFVLAELLRDPAGAVALLERHKRYLQAARLADASDLEVPVRIRTWMLAGDVNRAVRIARAGGGVAVAITMLRRTDPRAADALAIAWASWRAEAGDFVGAVDDAGAIPGAAALVDRWLDHAIAAGGLPGARMLALRAARSAHLDARTRALALLDDDSAELAPSRLAFAGALSREAPSPRVRTLARAAVRAVLREGAPPSDAKLADRLLTLAGNAALRADRPVAKPPTFLARLSDRASPLVVHVQANDVGSIAVLDAALLPSGRTVLALGEAGVRVVTPDGRRVFVVDVPAEELVVSDAGTRALAVARAGSLHRIARVDLVDGRGERWWEAPLLGFARTFDGSGWLVSERGTPMLVDVLDSGWSALTRVPIERCLHVARFGRAQAECSVFVLEGEEVHWLRYDPMLTRLRARSALASTEGAAIARVAVGAEVWLVLVQEDGYALRRGSLAGPTLMTPLPGAPAGRHAFVMSGGHIAYAARMPDGVRVDVRDTMGRELVHVLLDGATTAGLRISDFVLTIADDRGRVLALDLSTGSVMRDLRVRS